MSDPTGEKLSIHDNLRRKQQRPADEDADRIDLDFDFSQAEAPSSDTQPDSALDAGAVEWDLPEQDGPTTPPPPSPASAPDTSPTPAPQRPPLDDPLDQQPTSAAPTQSEESPAFPFPGFGDEDQEEQQPGGLDIQRILKGVLARSGMIALITILVTVAFAAIAFTLLNHSWIAQATLIKRDHQDQFQVGRFGLPFKPQKYSMKTMLDTLILPSSVDETMRRAGVALKRKDFIKQVDLKLGKESSIFSITVEWDDPQKAAEIANHLVEIFIERNRRIRRSDAEKTVLFYQKQLDEANEETRQINDRIQYFQQEFGLSDIATQIQVLVTDLSQLRLKRGEFQAQEDGLRSDLERLEGALTKEPEMIVQSSYYENPLGKKLSGLEWELEQARGRYTDENPKVIDLKKRIDKIKGLIGNGKDSGNESNTYARNPVLEELSVQRYKTQGRLKLAQSQRGATDKLIQQMSERLDLLTAKQKEYESLKSQLAASQQLRENLANRVNEARVIMLRNEADFEILERATPPQERESSGRKLLLIAGFILGGGGGLGLALLLELLDRRVRTRKDGETIGQTERVLEFQHAPEGEQIVIDAAHPNEAVAARFRAFINDLDAELDRQDWQSVAIVSHERQAGRSLIATNLAQSLGLKEIDTLLIDADLCTQAGERPATLYQAAPPPAGLKQLLQAEAKLEDVSQATETAHVHLIQASNKDHDPIQPSDLLLLGGRRMQNLAQHLKTAPERVLYDLPNLADNETAWELASTIGKAIFVLRSDHSERPAAQKTADKLRARGIDIIAVVVSDIPYRMIQGEPMYQADKKSQKAALKAAKKQAKAQNKQAKKLAQKPAQKSANQRATTPDNSSTDSAN